MVGERAKPTVQIRQVSRRAEQSVNESAFKQSQPIAYKVIRQKQKKHPREQTEFSEALHVGCFLFRVCLPVFVPNQIPILPDLYLVIFLYSNGDTASFLLNILEK